MMTPNSLRKVEQVALMRGGGWEAADTPGTLIVLAGTTLPMVTLRHAALIFFDVAHAEAWYFSHDSSEKPQRLTAKKVDEFFVCDGWDCGALEAAQFATWGALGVPAADHVISQAKKTFSDKDVFVCGHAFWHGRQFSAAPTLHLNGRGEVLHFLPAGGRAGVQVNLLSIPRLTGWSAETLLQDELLMKTQHLQMAKERVWGVLKDQNFEVVRMDPSRAHECLFLVVLRMVFPQREISVLLPPDGFSPPVKRLLQHLAMPVNQASPGQVGHELDLSRYDWVLIDGDLGELAAEINQTSQLIPKNFFAFQTETKR